MVNHDNENNNNNKNEQVNDKNEVGYIFFFNIIFNYYDYSKGKETEREIDRDIILLVFYQADS